jgi:bacillithiol biosynthesis cysteine-adding enzyme BshC
MATEDHDFEEVNHVLINRTKHSWDIDSKQQPVGRLSLQNFDDFAHEIISLATNDFAKKQLEEWSACYTSRSNLSIATRKLVHLLFANKGLVILDADTKPLKKLFVPIIKKDVLELSNFNALTATNNLLRKKYKTLVNGREINFFYLSEFGRKLIKKEGDVFVVDGTSLTFTTKQIIADIENNPEQYSPNVIMRPVYQELILPNLSYIGGPGEIAYWLQLKSVFEQNNISFPILTLRSFVLLLNEQHYNTLKRIGLSVDDLFAPSINIQRKLVALNNDGGQSEIIKNIANNIQAFIDIAMKTDNKIGSEIIHQKTTWVDLLEQQHRKLDKKQREKIANQFNKFENIKSFYILNDEFQERFCNILSYGITESLYDLIHMIFNYLNLNSTGIIVITKQG